MIISLNFELDNEELIASLVEEAIYEVENNSDLSVETVWKEVQNYDIAMLVASEFGIDTLSCTEESLETMNDIIKSFINLNKDTIIDTIKSNLSDDDIYNSKK